MYVFHRFTFYVHISEYVYKSFLPNNLLLKYCQADECFGLSA